MDTLAAFKEAQKQGWAHFAPLEAITTPAAARLVTRAGVQPGHTLLDVACGTGVVAITAARRGATVTGLDLTPELLARARENSKTAAVDIDWHEGDAEQLPFPDAAFDIVVSQFGHMFAPRPDITIGQMLRVLKPGGTIAFSTWPPTLLVGRMFSLIGRYMPPPPEGVSPSPLWGDPNVVRERLGAAVTNLSFDMETMLVPALSPANFREHIEQTAGPVRKLSEALTATDPQKLAIFRAEFEALASEYLDNNVVRQTYLITRATKI
jgi:SAM-dependent methyltransferase